MRILDTDVCIEILRGNQQVIERRAAIIDEVATTRITACELSYGAEKSRGAAKLQLLRLWGFVGARLVERLASHFRAA